MPVWSSVNIAGVPLKDISPRSGSEKDGENWKQLHTEVVKCDEVVRSLKGYSAWSLALAIAHLCETIFSNSNRVLPVSTYVQVFYCFSTILTCLAPIFMTNLNHNDPNNQDAIL